MKSVLIIGGGVSGLTAGILAQKSGYRSIIIEKHFELGGNLTGWQRGEYHIDNCIHWLTGTNKNDGNYKVWQDIGAFDDQDIIYNQTLYSYQLDGKTLSLSIDLDKLENDMLSASPTDEKSIKRLIKAVESMQRIMGVGGKAHDEKSNGLSRVKDYLALSGYLGLTCGQLAKKFDNRLIRGFLSKFLTENFSSIALIAVFATFTGKDGGLYKGGSLKMAERLKTNYLSLGGNIILGKAVESVNHFEGSAYSATLSDGSTVAADAFILTCDPMVSFKKLLDFPLPAAFERLYNDKKLSRFSAFQCAFKVEDVEKMPFRGEVVFDLDGLEKDMLMTDYIAVREFSHEPSFAPKGQTVIQSMFFLSERACRQFIELKNDAVNYADKKKFYASVVLRAIERNFPTLKGLVKLLDVWTPATYKRFVSSDVGSFMSFAFSSNVLPRRIGSKVDGLDNVFLATQWQQAPGGLPIAASCGAQAARLVENLFRKERPYGAVQLKNLVKQ